MEIGVFIAGRVKFPVVETITLFVKGLVNVVGREEIVWLAFLKSVKETVPITLCKLTTVSMRVGAFPLASHAV